MQRAERHGCVHAQHAAGLRLQTRNGKVGFFQVGEDGDAALVISLPVLGRTGAAGRADKQLLPAERDSRNSRAAAAKLPCCTTLVKALMLVSLSISARPVRAPGIVLKSETETPIKLR